MLKLDAPIPLSCISKLGRNNRHFLTDKFQWEAVERVANTDSRQGRSSKTGKNWMCRLSKEAGTSKDFPQYWIVFEITVLCTNCALDINNSFLTLGTFMVNPVNLRFLKPSNHMTYYKSPASSFSVERTLNMWLSSILEDDKRPKYQRTTFYLYGSPWI